MTCGPCSSPVERILGAQAGVAAAVNPATRRAAVALDEAGGADPTATASPVSPGERVAFSSTTAAGRRAPSSSVP